MPYTHVVKKAEIPTVSILGVEVAAINMEWLVSFTTEHLHELSGDYMCFTNVHATVMSYENAEYCQVQNSGILAAPDGGPLALVGRKRGYIMERTPGPSYMERILAISAKQGYSHYFYGSTDETLDLLRINLEQRYPGLRIVGMYSPPFRPLTNEEDTQIVNSINALSPDFVWVGLGAPKQEEWMAKHQGKVKGLMVGVGAAFDYGAGNIKRAPQWMQRTNLEWFYRLMQDPKRLFMRYFVTNRKFIWHAIIRGR